MLIATWYTPSHADMAQRFVIDRYKQAGFSDCLFHIAKQTCPSASFKQPGWNGCTAAKLAWLGDMPADDEPVLFVDADVAVFPGLADWCQRQLDLFEGENVVLFQNDFVQLCTGVMLFRRTVLTMAWFQLAYLWSSFMAENDQDGMHLLGSIRKQLGCGEHLVKCCAMPSEQIANWRGLGFTKPWQGEDIAVFGEMLLWHANWCVGVEAKTKMLEQVVATHEALAAA